MRYIHEDSMTGATALLGVARAGGYNRRMQRGSVDVNRGPARGEGRGRWQMARGLAGAALAVLAACGCSTTAMKGTPFFTGEYARRTGPVENRVNLWPLLYYREPALSLLWPFGEYTGDRLAVRPLFSIEHLDQEERIYNVLWPLGRFDMRRDEHRFFPLFWGDDHRVVFPLYWHYDQPFATDGKGSDALWPLWCYFSDREQYSLHLLWPLFNAKSYDDERGWRLWPLYGSYEKPRAESGHSYALWPLAWHTWDKARESHTLLPLFHYAHAPDDYLFGTLLGGWFRDRAAGTTDWCALPLLGWGSSAPGASRATALLGLYGTRRDASSRHSRLLPLYYSSETAERSLFLSPLYASGASSDGASWRVVVPLALQRRSAAGSALYTPLYSRGADSASASRWSCLLPLYYEDSSPEGATFLTALGGWWTDAAQRSWAIYPLLSGGRRRAGGGELWLGGPLFHAAWEADGASHWLLPLYAYDHHDGSFLSPLYSSWENEDSGTTRLLPPLLSGYASRTNRWDLWALAGIGHFSGGPEAGSSHLFPLFYADHRADTFVSPLYAAWGSGEGRARAVPALLSGWYSSDREQEIIGLLGLFRARWGDQETSDTGHLLPLYYYDHETFLTPLLGHWHDGGTTMRYWLTPLLGTRSGHERGSWLAPLYGHAYDPVRDLAHGWFLIFGNYRRDPHAANTGFPLLFEHESWSRDGAAARDGWRFNLLLLAQGASYDYTQRRYLPTIVKGTGGGAPAVAEEPLHRGECRLFPLWNYRSDRGVTSDWQRASGSLLLCLYDYKRERGRVAPDVADHDYTRRRLLFRLYHHERLNGATSIDIFPAMTYDRDEAAGKRQFSLLWRLFRYERTPERRAVDLLFVPVWRSRGGPGAVSQAPIDGPAPEGRASPAIVAKRGT